jgi:hypothetical protein
MDKNAKKRKTATGPANAQRSDNKAKSHEFMGMLPPGTQADAARGAKGAGSGKSNRGGRGS